MDAAEHRRRAEQLLDRAHELDVRPRRDDTLITQVLLAANAHASLYLGDQFATEFDPRATPAAARPEPVSLPVTHMWDRR